MEREPAGAATPARNPALDDAGLKRQIMDFAGAATLEITPHDRDLLTSLAGRLPAGTTLYVVHTPHSSLADVADAACAVEAAGFSACPHIVARRISSRAELGTALDRLARGGVTRALLVAGDPSQPAGAFRNALDILDSGALAGAGIASIGVAGHPEGNARIDAGELWRSLLQKQEYGERNRASVHIVSQFGFNPAALVDWDRELTAHGISLPVHVGIAGPASLASLARYALRCGIGASFGALLTSPGSLGALQSLVKTVDEIFPAIVRLRTGALRCRIARPHFFPFGGVLRSVGWLDAVRAGRFDIEAGTGSLVVQA